MAERYVKSLFWLVGFTGLGYSLLVTLSPQEDSLKPKLPGVIKSQEEVLEKRQQLVDVLQAAANSNQPLYRLNKPQIDREIRDK